MCILLNNTGYSQFLLENLYVTVTSGDTSVFGVWEPLGTTNSQALMVKCATLFVVNSIGQQFGGNWNVRISRMHTSRH